MKICLKILQIEESQLQYFNIFYKSYKSENLIKVELIYNILRENYSYIKYKFQLDFKKFSVLIWLHYIVK